jgi:hypothetical protein
MAAVQKTHVLITGMSVRNTGRRQNIKFCFMAAAQKTYVHTTGMYVQNTGRRQNLRLCFIAVATLLMYVHKTGRVAATATLRMYVQSSTTDYWKSLWSRQEVPKQVKQV